MSEQKFQEAKGNLAFSQVLLDKHRGSHMAQPQGEMEQPMEESQQAPEQPVEAPQTPQEAPQQEQPQEETKESPTSMLSTFMDEVRALFKTKEEGEKKTQELVDKHQKDMDEIKEGLADIIKEDDKES